MRSVMKHRNSIEQYIKNHPIFLTTLIPYQAESRAPIIIQDMVAASQLVGVGPMAAVAGSIAEAVGKDLLTFSEEVIIENGGDIYMKTSKKRIVGIYAGQSALVRNIALEIAPGDTPLGICTSSGTIGHSLSFGNVDAVTVLSASTPLADAAATALGNIVNTADDIPRAIEKAKSIEGLRGVVIIIGDCIGLWGAIKLCRIAKNSR